MEGRGDGQGHDDCSFLSSESAHAPDQLMRDSYARQGQMHDRYT